MGRVLASAVTVSTPLPVTVFEAAPCALKLIQLGESVAKLQAQVAKFVETVSALLVPPFAVKLRADGETK